MEKQMNQAKIMEEAKSSLLATDIETQTKSHKDPSFQRKLIIIGFVLPFTLLAICANQALKKVRQGITYKLYLLHENLEDGKTLTMADGISNDVRLLIGLQLLIFVLSRLTLLFVLVDTAYYFAETYSGVKLNVKELFLKIGRIGEIRPLISCFYVIVLFLFLTVFSGILFGIMLGLAEGVSSIMSLKVES